MPRYEITLITKPLVKLKTELVKTLTRAAGTLLDNGAVITDVQSLGHRDLPVRRRDHSTGQAVYSSNYFLYNTWLNRRAFLKAYVLLKNDMDLMHIGYVADHEKAAQPEECTLHEMLKPPAYRESVEKLRKIQKLNAFSRSIIYKKTEREWRALPKSYPVDKMRQ